MTRSPLPVIDLAQLQEAVDHPLAYEAVADLCGLGAYEASLAAAALSVLGR